MWAAARILMGVGVGAGCGLELIKSRTTAVSEEGEIFDLNNLKQCPYLYWDWNWDRRAVFKKSKNGNLPEIDEKHHSQHSRHVICVSSGLCFKLPGSPICGLQKEGRVQVLNLTRTLLSTSQQFRNIHYSPMKQDRETAEALYQGARARQPDNPPNLILEEMLEEGPTVVPIPLTSSALPNGAHLFQEQCKIEAAFRKLFYRLDKSFKDDVFDIVVAQPDIIKYFICRALQFPPEALSRFHLNWASITWFTIAGNGVVTAFAIGDTGYQPPSLLVAK